MLAARVLRFDHLPPAVEEPNPSTVVPIILQAMIAEDNDAFKEEIKRWEANAGERELRRAEQNVVTELIQKFKDRVAVLCTTTLDERNDPRLLSFEHFLLHLGSEDVMQRTILNAVFEEQFPGESLSVRAVHDAALCGRILI